MENKKYFGENYNKLDNFNPKGDKYRYKEGQVKGLLKNIWR